jgi:predicted alpha/beta-fold hydrolase
VPPEQFDAPVIRHNPDITVVVTRDGGHCGYLEDATVDDGYWAERMVVAFAEGHAAGTRRHPWPQTGAELIEQASA